MEHVQPKPLYIALFRPRIISHSVRSLSNSLDIVTRSNACKVFHLKWGDRSMWLILNPSCADTFMHRRPCRHTHTRPSSASACENGRDAPRIRQTNRPTTLLPDWGLRRYASDMFLAQAAADRRDITNKHTRTRVQITRELRRMNETRREKRRRTTHEINRGNDVTTKKRTERRKRYRRGKAKHSPRRRRNNHGRRDEKERKGTRQGPTQPRQPQRDVATHEDETT